MWDVEDADSVGGMLRAGAGKKRFAVGEKVGLVGGGGLKSVVCLLCAAGSANGFPFSRSGVVLFVPMSPFGGGLGRYQMERDDSGGSVVSESFGFLVRLNRNMRIAEITAVLAVSC